MITAILLILIYLAFISLGLPDSILGVALPAIRDEWGLQLRTGGLIATVIVGSTIISSFASGHIIKRVGTGKIVFFSCLMTGLALFGFSAAPSFIWLIILAVPLGLGGGSVDASLNNYVASHFKAHHMNWLHSFWGVGATLGPVIMSISLKGSGLWRSGYRTISLFQLSLALILLLSLSVWKKADKQKTLSSESETPPAASGNIKPEGRSGTVFGTPGVAYAFAVMMSYVSVEASIGLWGSSFLIQARGYAIDRAALLIAMYFGGITVGRFFSGFLSFRLSNIMMIRLGILISLTGIILLLLPLKGFMPGAAVILTGLGLSPIFPAMMHETPNRFGKELSQVLIGYQMGFAGIGSAVLSPLMGVLLQASSIKLFPLYIIILSAAMLVSSERLTKATAVKV